MSRPLVCLWCLFLLLGPSRSQIQPVSGAAYLHLQSSASRNLAQDGPPSQQKHPCHGQKAGAPVPGQFVLMFKPGKVDSIEEGVGMLLEAFDGNSAQSQKVSVASVPFEVVSTIGIHSRTKSSTVGVSSSGRRLQQSIADNPLPMGLLLSASDAAVDVIKRLDAVEYIENDVCVRVAQDIQADSNPSYEFGCLPASQVSGITIMPIPQATWPRCLVPNSKLAWWGVRCGPSNSQIIWTGVYAYSALTGDPLPGCLKIRDHFNPVLTDDIMYWLGEACGTPPAAVPSMPGWICMDPFEADSCAATSAQPEGCPNQNCIPFGSPVQQIVQIMHPSPACKPVKPIRMKFVGERCYGDGLVSATLPAAGVLWLSAVPAEELDDSNACSLSRSAGTSPEDLLFNQNYFGSCGVPPARIQYLAWGECPPPPPPPSPPPPSPPPPPPPRQRRLLPREVVRQGAQTTSTGVQRIMAVTSTGSGAFEVAKPVLDAKVAVLDTGIECNHPDLNVAYARAFIPERSPDPNQEPPCYDGYGHGTHCAGIIGALNNNLGVVGILPNTPIVALKVLDASGLGTTSTIIKALTWLLDTSVNGTTPNPGNITNAQHLNINVINMSFGFFVTGVTQGNYQTLCSLLTTLVEGAGMVAVAAASNDQLPLNNIAPASCAHVIATTSINPGFNGDINPQQQASWFTNYLLLSFSPTYLPHTPDKINTTLAAPGNSINSTCSVWKSRSGYCTLSGTSQATPHVSGVYARCFSSGACSAEQGLQNLQIGLDEFQEYNTLLNTEYGFQQDPLRGARNATKYYGFLVWAGAW